MNNSKPSANIVLSQETQQRLRDALNKLSQFIPDIDRIRDCDGECQEIADFAASLQTRLTKYLHHFGGNRS